MSGFEKLVNFRDLGGLTGAGGRRVKEGRLLRSGEVRGLTPGDRALLLGQYGLRAIFDLRSPEEIAKSPNDTLPGVTQYHIDITKDTRDGLTGSEQLRMFSEPERMRAYMLRIYGMLVENPCAAQEFGRMIGLLLDVREGAALFHCYAGKDRTGVTAAVLLTALGVGREQIMEDYLRTNELRRDANRALLEAAGRDSPDTSLEAYELALTVSAEYLDNAYDTAERLYGSFENYVFERIGVSEDTAARLRELYLE